MSHDTHEIEKRKQDYLDKSYMGIIEDPNDPRKEGRCKIRVFGIHDDLSTEDLPWAYPKQKSTFFGHNGKAGSLSIPKKNSAVAVGFNNGNIYSPEYYSIHELEDTVRHALEKDGEYLGSHIILFDGDESLKIWYTIDKGLTLQLKKSRINIASDSAVTIEHMDSDISPTPKEIEAGIEPKFSPSSSIELRGGEINITTTSTTTITSPSEIDFVSNDIHVNGKYVKIGHSPIHGSAVLGDQLFNLLTQLASIIDSKVPTSLGLASGLVSMNKSFVLSETVKVSK